MTQYNDMNKDKNGQSKNARPGDRQDQSGRSHDSKDGSSRSGKPSDNVRGRDDRGSEHRSSPSNPSSFKSQNDKDSHSSRK